MRSQVGLAAIAALMFFINLGVPRLWDVDEAIFSQAAKEMLQRHDHVVPYFNAAVFPDKPALMYWLMISAYEVFGPTEFAARFWSAVFGIGSVLVTYQLGRLMFSPAVGFWSGLILASNLNFNVIARAATPDAFLVFFSSLAVLIFVKGALSASSQASGGERALTWAGQTRFEPSWGYYSLTYAAMGCGLLTKGPVGVVLPTAVIGLFLLVMRAQPVVRSHESGWRDALRNLLRSMGSVFSIPHFFQTVWSMRPLTALGMVALVAGPWYVWVGLRTDGQWLVGFFGVHNFGRFLNAMENHRGPIFYYLLAIAVGFFPWSVLFGPSIMHMKKQLGAAEPTRPGYVLIASWFAVWVGFFSLAGTKLPSYVVPAYPALALFTGVFVEHWLREPRLVSRTWTRMAWGTVALAGLAMLVALPIIGRVYLHGDWLLGTLGIIPLVAAAAGLYFSERGQVRPAIYTLSLFSVVLAIAMFGFAAVHIDDYQPSHRFATVIAQNTPPGEPVKIGSFRYFRPSFVFYTDHAIEEFGSDEQVQAFFGEPSQNRFLFTTAEQYELLAPMLPSGVTVLDEQPRFLGSGKVLLLGQTPHGSATATKPAAGSDSALQ